MAGLIVKICGVTREDDARTCVDLGADMVGLNFVAASPRCVTIDRARAICAALRGRAVRVGVVADASPTDLERLLAEVELDRLQLHGDESPEVVAALGPRAFKAVRIGDAGDALRADRFGGEPLLVDAKVAGRLGGTGRRVAPGLVAPLAARRAVLLAGGLDPTNVADAVRAVRPWGVDVSSGVETSPGVKDASAVAAFVRAARDA